MHEPYEGGTQETIQGITVFIPPKPSKHHILGSHLPKKDQKWYRTELPVFFAKDIDWFIDEPDDPMEEITWDEARRQEIIKQTGCDPMDIDRSGNPKKILNDNDPFYVCEAIDNFRANELDRVVNGVWVMINGNAIYLPGVYYFYLNYWKLDDGFPLFRDNDRKVFYVWEFVRKHPVHLGMIYITMRGEGKSFKAGCMNYYEAITNANAHCGIQSKTDNDAADFFRTKILAPVAKLPDFLVPVNKHVGDITKNNELDFSPPSRRTLPMNYFRKVQKDALRSFMDFRNAGEFAYDSTTLAMLIQDEIGKTDPRKVADVKERLQKNIFCVYRGTKKRGVIFATSTVEKMEEGGKQCKAIWDDSDIAKLSGNGRTKSGILRMFTSALDASFYDEYGYSEREKAKKHHDAERESLKDDPKALVGYVQKNPYTSEEAFMTAGDKCIYHRGILQERLMFTSNPDYKGTQRGDFVWKDNIPDSQAIFVPNASNGKCWVSWLPQDEKDTNLVKKEKDYNGFERKIPLNGHRFVMAFDPYSHKKTVDNRASSGSSSVYKKYDFHVDDYFNDTFCVDYLARPLNPEDCFEDQIIIAHFFGSPVLIENNKNSAVQYFERRGYSDFVMSRPESTYTNTKNKSQDTPGIPSNKPMIDYYVNTTAAYIIKHGRKLKHQNIIESWLEFDPNNTTEFDSAVSASYALVATEKRIEKESTEQLELTSFIPSWDHSGDYGEMAY